MKTTKVKSVQGNGSFDHEHGAVQADGKKLMFRYDYEFEDGTFLQANHKTVPSPFKVGDTVEYEVKSESLQYGKKGRVVKPEMSVYSTSIHGGTPKQPDDGLQGVKIGHAINNAVQFALKDTSVGEWDIENKTNYTLENCIKSYAKMILKIGEELNAEISKQSNIATGPTQTAPSHTQPVQPPLEDYRDTDNIIDDDLPY